MTSCYILIYDDHFHNPKIDRVFLEKEDAIKFCNVMNKAFSENCDYFYIKEIELVVAFDEKKLEAWRTVFNRLKKL